MRNLMKVTLVLCLAMGFCACQGTEQKTATPTQAAPTQAASGAVAKATGVQVIYFGSPG